MLMETEPMFSASSMVGVLGLDSTLPSEPIQIRQIQPSVPAVSETYPESAYQWLVEVLDGLIDFGGRHGHHDVINLSEDEYQWLDDVLEELIYSVGENQNHLLASLMVFITRFIANYEEAYVPKLTELFPELAEEAPIEISANKNLQPVVNPPKLEEDELAAHAFFSIAFLLYHGNYVEKTFSAYDKAIALKPDLWEAYYNRGLARNDLNQYKEAIANFNKVIALNPDFVKAYVVRGYTKERLGEHQTAIDDFDKAIALGLNSAEIYYYRAIAKNKLRQHDIAIPDYDKAIALKPDFVEAYNIRGFSWDKLGQHNEAIADYTEAIRLKSDYAEAYANRGIARVKLNRIDEARADLQTALKLAEQQGQAGLKVSIEERLKEKLDFFCEYG